MAGIADAALARTDHRPWPLPQGPWVLRQRWLNLLFMHWRVPASILQPLIPKPLILEEFDGSSWIGVVPFQIVGFGGRWLPGSLSFLEVNLRTYVELEGKPGVWFFSLDAASTAAVIGARATLRLPYFRAEMSSVDDGMTGITFESSRRADRRIGFRARYQPTGSAYFAAPGTLDHFLTERYCLYTRWHDGRIRRLQIQHPPWSLQAAQVRIDRNSLAAHIGCQPATDGPPLVHYSARQDVIAWPPEKTASGRR